MLATEGAAAERIDDEKLDDLVYELNGATAAPAQRVSTLPPGSVERRHAAVGVAAAALANKA